MRNTQPPGRSNKLTGLIGVYPLNLTSTAEVLEGKGGLILPLVLDRDAGDKARPKVLEINSILEATNAMFATLLIRHQVVCCDNIAPFLRLPPIRPTKKSMLGHLAPATYVAVFVEGFMPQ